MLGKIVKYMLYPLYRTIIRTGIISPLRYRKAGLRLEWEEWKRVHNIQDDKALSSKLEIGNAICRELIRDDPIDFLEFGVHEGAGIKRWMGLSQNPESRFFGFDTFRGLPEAWAELPQGGLDVRGKTPVLDDNRVEFVAGLFQDSLASFLETFNPRNRLVLRMDADLYSSTLFVLTSLDRFIEPGTIIIFDQFSCLPDEFSAFVDYTRSFYRDYEVFAYRKDCLKMAIIMK